MNILMQNIFLLFFNAQQILCWTRGNPVIFPFLTNIPRRGWKERDLDSPFLPSQAENSGFIQSHAEELVFVNPEAVARSMNTLAVWENKKKNDCFSNINKKRKQQLIFFRFCRSINCVRSKNSLSVNDVRMCS